MKEESDRTQRDARRSARSLHVPLLAVLTAVCSTAHGQEPAMPSVADRVATGSEDPAARSVADRGIEFGFASYGDYLTVVDGGLDERTSQPGLMEPSLALDLDKLFGWQATRVYVRGIGTYGRDPADSVGAFNAPSNLANEVDTFKMMEAWIERSFADETLAVLVGLYAADSEFDVKETAGVFINGGFGTGVDLSESGANGPCIFPTSCVGVRVRYQPTPNYYGQVAVLDGAAGDPDDPRGTHVQLSSDDGALVLGEVGFQRSADEGRFVRAALGAWSYTAKFDRIAVDDQGEPLTKNGTYGVYALLEGELLREPGQTTQGLSGFARIGMADQDVHAISYYASGGFAYTGLMPRRDEDVMGLGVSVPFTSATYRRSQRLADVPVADRELAIEWTYWAPVASWLSVQVDVQYIMDPGADPTIDDALLVGVRYQVSF